MPQMLVSGRPIAFGSAGNYKTWATRGWSQEKDQPDITWMVGNVASLEFIMPPPEMDLLMVARLMPFSFDGAKQHQQLHIFLNGLFVDLWMPTTKEFCEYSALLRKSFFSEDSANSLTFVAPNAIAPSAIGISPDQRQLSFALMQLTLQDPTRRPHLVAQSRQR